MNRTVEQFYTDLSMSKSKNTVRSYRTPINRFVSWLTEQEITDPSKLTSQLAVQFVRTLHNSGLKAASINGYITGLSAFYRWLALESIIDLAEHEELKARVRDLRPAVEPVRRLPDEQAIQAIIAVAYQDKGGTIRQNLIRLRNIAILETLRSTGMRVGELVSLKCGDLNGETQTVRYRGKGNKKRLGIFTDQAWLMLNTYLALREDDCAEYDTPVFARYDRGAPDLAPMSTDAVRKMLAELAEKAGVEYIVPHKFRHRFATRILAKTGNLASAQELMGHASPATTRRYADVPDADLMAAHRSASQLL